MAAVPYYMGRSYSQAVVSLMKTHVINFLETFMFTQVPKMDDTENIGI